jgi:hypothetical protein
MSRSLSVACVSLLTLIILLAGTTGQTGERKEGKSPGESALSAEERIEKALGQPATFEFFDTPLTDVVEALREASKINVVLDRRALEEIGIPADAGISFQISNVSLQSALNLMLGQLDLTWTIQDEVLLITTPEGAEERLITKVYDVADLVICRDASGELWADYDTLIHLIKWTIEPATWDHVGGAGTAEGASFRGAETLTVSQTYQIHQKISQFLEDLRAVARKKGPDAEPPLRERPKPEAPVVDRTFMWGMGLGTGGLGKAGPEQDDQSKDPPPKQDDAPDPDPF